MKKINLFDLITVLIIIVFVFVIVTGIVKKNSINNNNKILHVTVRVLDDTGIVYNAAKNSNHAYLNSINSSSYIVVVKRDSKEQSPNYTYITLQGLGVIKGNVYIFNGTRILINQKAEIRGSFIAQGVIYEISEEV